ncbi:MAG: DUF6261 family protein [Bacteroidales bacterium]|nr:DUF6261 family protein [Bacteroidales bacterium]
MIAKLISQVRISEISTIATSMLLIYNEHEYKNDLNLKVLFTELETESHKLTIAINRKKAESELATLNSACNYQLRALNYTIAGAIYHPDDVIKTASKTLSKVFNKYGLEIIRESYSVKSALLVSLLKDLAKSRYKKHITAISGCTEIIDKLQLAQQNFETAYFERKEQKANEKNILCACKVKSIVYKIINKKITPYLSVMLQINPSVYGKLARTVNQIISDINSDIKQRRKTKKPDPKKNPNNIVEA